jgi:hypothetical protein
VIDGLIDKVDTVERVRDQIGAILALEVASQMAFAAQAGKDSSAWKLRVFQERSNPWDNFPANPDDRSPIVNVWWDTSTFDLSAGNVVERQKSSTVYNVDCYGYGRAANDPAGGHVAGDQQAAEEVQRAVRLVRNILMAAEYTYLGLRGVVWRRWVDSISIFQPQQDNSNAGQVVGARLTFRVDFSEYAPQVTPIPIEYLSVRVHRREDGQIEIAADYDYSA